MPDPPASDKTLGAGARQTWRVASRRFIRSELSGEPARADSASPPRRHNALARLFEMVHEGVYLGTLTAEPAPRTPPTLTSS